jgi:hypothetical protein
MSDLHPDGDELPAWEQARLTPKMIGGISATFSSTVRSLLVSAGEDLLCKREKISPTALVMVRQLLKSPSVLVHLWYAAKSFYPEQIAERGKVTPEGLLEIFSIYELASLLTISYVNRKLVNALPESDWAPIAKSLQIYTDLSIPLGQVIPAVGPTRALLTSSARWLGWGAMTVQNPAAMKKYRVGLKVKKKYCDLPEELALLNTTHLHIACSLFTTFGFPTSITSALFQGLGGRIESLKEDEQRFRVASQWLDSLVVDNTAPEAGLGDQYLLAESQEERFLKKVESVLNDGSPFAWLSKRRTDLSPDLTPELDVDHEVLKKSHQRPRNPFATDQEEEDEEES